MTPAEKSAMQAAIEMLSEVSRGGSPEAVAMNDLIFRLEQVLHNRSLSKLEAAILLRVQAAPMTSNDLRAAFNRTHTAINAALRTLHSRRLIHIHSFQKNGGNPLRWWSAGNRKDAVRPPKVEKVAKPKPPKTIDTSQNKTDSVEPAKVEKDNRESDEFIPRRDPAAAWF